MYTATITDGQGFETVIAVSTIREGCAAAEEYGRRADRCVITDRRDRVIALHLRDQNGDGTTWFRAVAR